MSNKEKIETELSFALSKINNIEYNIREGIITDTQLLVCLKYLRESIKCAKNFNEEK
jgi:hypothetical protein